MIHSVCSTYVPIVGDDDFEPIDSDDRTQGIAPGQGPGPTNTLPSQQPPPVAVAVVAPPQVVMIPLPQSQWVVGTPVECNYGAKGELRPEE